LPAIVFNNILPPPYFIEHGCKLVTGTTSILLGLKASKQESFCYNADMSLAYWMCVAVTSLSALTSLGFSIVALVNSEVKAQVNAMYALTRSTALAIANTVLLFNHSQAWLEALATIMIIVQLDAVIGVKIHDKMKTYGPGATALINLAALIWFIQ
jgi:hypothetical protein